MLIYNNSGGKVIISYKKGIKVLEANGIFDVNPRDVNKQQLDKIKGIWYSLKALQDGDFIEYSDNDFKTITRIDILDI